MPGKKTVLSHRGRSGGEPENTLEAFAATVARGVDGIELDVRPTADGVLVVFHDSTVDEIPVESLSFAELAARVPRLCTFAEALATIPAGCLLDVEIKVPGIETDVLHELALRRSLGEVVVTSFCDQVVARVKALDPGVRVGLVLGRRRLRGEIGLRLSEHFPARRLRRCRADLVVPNERLLRFGFLRRMVWLGYPVIVWTVNEPTMLKRLFRHPAVAGVITDRSLEAMELRDAVA
jgi:glycerophosphoryl diester phosphodiesterase